MSERRPFFSTTSGIEVDPVYRAGDASRDLSGWSGSFNVGIALFRD